MFTPKLPIADIILFVHLFFPTNFINPQGGETSLPPSGLGSNTLLSNALQ